MSDCIHHYMLERPNGPIAIGVCKFCGDKREHRNSEDNTRWVTNPYRKGGDARTKRDGITEKREYRVS